MIKLKPANGFPQRHSVAQKTPYLWNLGEVPEYTRSPITLDAIREDLFQYHNGTKYDYDNDIYMKLAVSMATQAFRTGPIHPMHICDVLKEDLDIWDSSPCLPWSNYGYKTKKEVIDDPSNIISIRKFWSFVKKGVKIDPPDSMAHVRSHLVKNGDAAKIRAVWGYPLTMVLGEATFALPIIAAFKKNNTPLAYGYETAIGGTKKIRNECKGNHFSAIDFKSFDKNVPLWLIDKAFDILEYHIDFRRYTDGSIPNITGLYRTWDYIKQYFKNTTIRLANGERYKKRVGIPSGSYFTQIIDSIVNYIIITWMYLKQHDSPPNYIKVMGDDSICSSYSYFDLDLAKQHCSFIGMNVNVSKSAVSKDISNLEFLGYRIADGYPRRDYQKWLSSLAYPEFPDSNWDEFATRALGLGYANACSCEKFDTLVRYIISIKPSFELVVGRSFKRWLKTQGIEHLDVRLPDPLYFMRRMGF